MKSKCLTYTVELTREEIDTVTTALNSEYKFLKENMQMRVNRMLRKYMNAWMRRVLCGMICKAHRCDFYGRRCLNDS